MTFGRCIDSILACAASCASRASSPALRRLVGVACRAILCFLLTGELSCRAVDTFFLPSTILRGPFVAADAGRRTFRVLRPSRWAQNTCRYIPITSVAELPFLACCAVIAELPRLAWLADGRPCIFGTLTSGTIQTSDKTGIVRVHLPRAVDTVRLSCLSLSFARHAFQAQSRTRAVLVSSLWTRSACSRIIILMAEPPARAFFTRLSKLSCLAWLADRRAETISTRADGTVKARSEFAVELTGSFLY